MRPSHNKFIKNLKALRKRYLVPLGFGDIEIVDAREPLRLQPIPRDAERAKGHEREGDKCVLAQTGMRQYSTRFVLVQKYFAYAILLDTDGVWRCFRYVVDSATRREIELFDRGRPFNVGRAFVLKVPTGNNRLDTRKAATQARRERYPTRHEIYDARQKRSNAEKKLSPAIGRLELAQERLRDLERTEKPRSVRFTAASQRVVAARNEVRDLREKIADAKIAECKAANSKSADKPIRAYNVIKYDLTTRNGVVGNYRFKNAA